MRIPALVLGSMVFLPLETMATGTHPPHSGASPWSFTVVAEPSSRFIVNDTDSPTIDKYLYRSQGPIVIDIPIRRYVGKTDADGHLLNSDELVLRGIVSKNAKVTLPAYDIDAKTYPMFDCDGDGIDDRLLNEVDRLYLNDEEIGTLKGDDGVWTSQSFDVPISKLKFPSTPGATAINRFRVDIDTDNRSVVLSSGAIGCQVWAAAIDWIGLKFDASSPVVMVHGIRSSGAAFTHFKAGLENAAVHASDSTIVMTDIPAPEPIPPGCAAIPYNETYPDHVRQLRSLIPAIAERFGSETLHFVAHSKGGLDTRGFLASTSSSPIRVRVGIMGGQAVERDLVAASLITLNTPYGGSTLAKYGVEARQLSWLQASRAGINVAASKWFEGSYYCDLTPERATTYTASTPLPNGVQTGSVATNADCNGDQQIDGGANCPSGQAESANFTGGGYAATRLYQLIGRVADVKISVVPHAYRPDEIVVRETPHTTFQSNDVIVSQASAALYTPYSIDGWHHLNVHSERNAQAIASDAQSHAPSVVSWRNR